MGLFSSSKDKKIDYIKELENSNKYCELIFASTIERGKLEYKIAQRIKQGRLIKDIKLTYSHGDGVTFLILYDYEAEEKRRQQQDLEKNNSGDAWSQKLENDKNSNGWER